MINRPRTGLLLAAIAAGTASLAWLIHSEGIQVRRYVCRHLTPSAIGLDPEAIAAAREIARRLLG